MNQIQINIIIGIMLFLCTIKDIKKKEISYIAVITGGIATLLIFLQWKDNSVWNQIGGSAVGIVMMAISKLSRGQIGMGDGIILIVTGMGLGMWNNISLLVYALFFAAVFSFTLMIGKKISKKDTIPFVPFLFLGYVSVLVIG